MIKFRNLPKILKANDSFHGDLEGSKLKLPPLKINHSVKKRQVDPFNDENALIQLRESNHSLPPVKSPTQQPVVDDSIDKDAQVMSSLQSLKEQAFPNVQLRKNITFKGKKLEQALNTFRVNAREDLTSKDPGPQHDELVTLQLSATTPT